jgi:hypothetical protein
MEENILAPKWAKNKKPIKKRKPSRPIDGINHRLMAEQVTQVLETVAVEVAAVPEDDAPPTRAELEAKAIELNIPFNGRTSDKKLGKLIQTALEQGV